MKSEFSEFTEFTEFSKFSLTNKCSRRDFVAESTNCFLACLMAGGLGNPTVLASPLKGVKACSVPTLTGMLDCNKLGTTLMHEHVLWFSGPRLDNPGYTPIPEDLRSDTVDFAISLLNAAARVGIDTVVDLTPHRPIELYEQIAKGTSVKIIVSTGFYRRAKIPQWMADMEDEKQMEDLMLKEVSEGIQGTKFRAGIIKVAGEGNPLSDWEKKVFRAAARVHKATHAPMATHVGSREQFDLLVKAGVNPAQILLSHVDTGRRGRTRVQLAEELLSIAKEGGYLEVDTFGQEFYTPWNDLVFLLRYLCDAGYANRIVISIDSNWHWVNRKKVFEGSEEPYFDPHAADRTFAYMVTDVVPMLLKAGFSKKEIDTFLVGNPRQFFSN